LIWRKQKGHKNFISTSEIVKARDKFPFSYNALSLRKGNELVGTAFFLIMDTKQIYVYSLITDPFIDFQEPSLLLWKAIYEWAQSINISTIDMGTSMLADGRIKKSLMHYKLFIGGSLYKKYTLEC
jgi:lipid II:glycine glycyltransferase (peptidoglycan interpeptide bridge formation enzyme)